jgi:serine/threonine-protein kinase
VLPSLVPPPPAAAALRSRLDEREEAAEGGVWPVVIALVLSAVVGTALGWWWLSRGRLVLPTPDAALQLPNSLPPAEVDQRQQLLNRLRAMQVDRGWFLKLVDASLLAQFPERGGRLPSDSLEDAPLRKVWNELSEEWLARVEQLPLDIRRRLGSYTNGDWERRQQSLVSQGLSSAVLRQLVSGSAQSLLPGRPGADIPPEPFRQLWFAAAEQGLANVQIEAIEAQPQETRVLSAQVEAGGARLFPVRLPPGYRLVLGVNGSPLMQMSVFGPDGDLLEAKGPLRVVSLGAQKRSPVQVLVTNEGVAPALITLSLRADPPVPQQVPQPSPQPPSLAPQDPAQAPAVPAPAVPAAPAQPTAPPPPVP